jgi:hypothetical protein
VVASKLQKSPVREHDVVRYLLVFTPRQTDLIWFKVGPPGQEQLGACRNATASECFIKCDDRCESISLSRMTFVDLLQKLVTNWTRKKQTVCSTELTPPSTTKIALITFLGAILLQTPSWVVFANASRRTNGVNVCLPSLIFTPCSADHIDYITRPYRWWKGFMFPQCRFISRRVPTRVSRRVRIYHRWWPFSLPRI